MVQTLYTKYRVEVTSNGNEQETNWTRTDYSGTSVNDLNQLSGQGPHILPNVHQPVMTDSKLVQYLLSKVTTRIMLVEANER